MFSDDRKMKKIIVLLVALNLLIWGGLIAMAEVTAPEDRSPAEMELDAIVQVLDEQPDSFYGLHWDKNGWFQDWVKQYGLEGVYGYGWDGPWSWEKERDTADIALAYWEEVCGITPFNDFSMASEVHPIQHTLGDQVRFLVLVNRIHDDRMPNFYVLLDGETNAVLATTSVEEYLMYHAQMERIVEAERALEDKLRQKGVEAVMEKYAAQLSWLNDEYLQSAEIYAFEEIRLQTDLMARKVEIIPAGGMLPEFEVEMDEQGEEIYLVRWYAERYDRYTEEQYNDAQQALMPLENAYLQLIADYGEDYKIPMEERIAFYQQCRDALDENNRWDFLGFFTVLRTALLRDQAMVLPEEGDITQEAAQNAVIEALISEYGLTEEQAKSLSCYFALYQDGAYTDRYWQLKMDLGNETLFEAQVNAATGEIISLFKAAGQAGGRDTEMIAALEARYGDWGVWPIDIKAQYAHIYLGGEHDFGMPGDGDLSVDQALELAKTELLARYPELTRDQLDYARLCPYFTTRPHLLYGTVYEPPIYYFAFDVDGISVGYEIILDGKTGEVYLTHDPIHSGNG